MKSDNDSFFVDANVLVYAAVKDDPRNEVANALAAKSEPRHTARFSPDPHRVLFAP